MINSYFKKRFNQFILDEDIKIKSLLNLLGRTSNNNQRSLNDYLNDCKPKNYIDGMGVWAATTEGQKFWCDKNEKWQTILASMPLTGVTTVRTTKNKDKCKSIW